MKTLTYISLTISIFLLVVFSYYENSITLQNEVIKYNRRALLDYNFCDKNTKIEKIESDGYIYLREINNIIESYTTTSTVTYIPCYKSVLKFR